MHVCVSMIPAHIHVHACACVRRYSACTCACACACACTYACACVYALLHVHVTVHICACACAYACACVYAQIHVHVNVHTHVPTGMCMYTCIYVCTGMCTAMHIDMHTAAHCPISRFRPPLGLLSPCRHRTSGVQVAIKRIKANDFNAANRALEEANQMSRLRHGRLVELKRVFISPLDLGRFQARDGVGDGVGDGMGIRVGDESPPVVIVCTHGL